MSSPELTIHGFETSNNMKVRIALGYKSIPYEFRTIEPTDRGEIQRISGQHLTPVMQHADVVLFDSAAILRYLDGTFPETPRLFGDSHKSQWEIEDWELFARTRLASPMMRVVHSKVYGTSLDDAALRACSDDFASALTELADQLGDREWIVGDAMTAADIHAAAVLHRVTLARIFDLPAAAEALEPWRARVMAFDGIARVG